MSDPGDDLMLHRAPEGLVDAALSRRATRRARRHALIGLAAGMLIGVGIGGAVHLWAPAPSGAATPLAMHEPRVQQAEAPVVLHRFVHFAPEAERVFVAGTFNGWRPEATPLIDQGEGIFRTTLRLSPGRHEYMLVVDGVWVSDPQASLTVDDGFGRRNAVLQL